MPSIHDVIIIGSGPSAYAASLYTSKASPILFEGKVINGIGPGGQLTTTTHVDNYPGFPRGIQGPALMECMKDQAQERDITIVKDTVVSVKKEDGLFVVSSNSSCYKCRAVIVASGASARRLHVPGAGDDEFWQKGISACAVCDGYAFMDSEVCVIGGGDSAMEEVLFLSKICSKVYLIHRRNDFRSRVDKLDEVRDISNVEILTPYNLKSVHGDNFLRSIKIEHSETKEIRDLKVDGLFFGIGHIPNTKFLDGLDVSIDNDGYINVDEYMRTNVEGLFAAGDVCDRIYKQAVTAASSGCVAGIKAMEYLNKN